MISHQVTATDMRPYTVSRLDADAFLAEIDRLLQDLFRKDPVLDNLLLIVDIGDEHVQGFHPLLQTFIRTRPLPTGDDPRDDVERPHPVDTITF